MKIAPRDVHLGMASDDRLIADALRGSDRAVAALFDAYWLTAWRAAHAVTGRADLADDAAQEAFVNAVRSLRIFKRGRPFAPWIARIAVNRARDLLREERRRAAVAERHAIEGQRLPPMVATDHNLLDDIAALPTERREVIVLHHVLGYSLREVAEIVGVPEGTVASRVSRALSELRERMEASEHA